MNDSQALSQEDLFSTYASASALAEANAFRTVPTNYYKAVGVKHDAKLSGPTEQFPNGRVIINARVELSREDKKAGSISMFLSPAVGRTKTGKLDREFRLYNQLVRALYPEITNEAEFAGISTGALLERFTQYPVGMFVTETFASEPDGISGAKTYLDAKTDAEAAELRKKGWKANNYVQSVGKFKS